MHAYVLLHFVLLAGKVGAFHLELQAQISGDDARARLRRPSRAHPARSYEMHRLGR
jgi:hypothetical protein